MEKEDFFDTEMELGFDEELFIRHVLCMSLTLIPVLKRIVKHFEPLCEYTLKELPKTANRTRQPTSLEEQNLQPYLPYVNSTR